MLTAETLWVRLGEALVRSGKLAERDLDRALLAQQEMGGLIGEVMIKLGIVAEQEVMVALSAQLSIPYISTPELSVVASFPDQVSREFLQTNCVCPMSMDADEYKIAFAYPQNDFVRSALELALGKRIIPYISEPSGIAKIFLQLSEEDSDVDLSEEDVGAGNEFIEHLKDLASEAPTIRLVSQILSDALDVRASDIHIEPFEDELHLRYRVDGVMRKMENLPISQAAAVVSRIKLLSGLNIAERRLPQDGRIKTRIKGREIDLRVSTVPIVGGESVVMRLLDRSSVRYGLGDMGFSEHSLNIFNELLGRPHGILLITGPTGSGKTTTLYGALSALNDISRKIITVEDPIEYQLTDINQIQVHPQIGLTFATALRSILRQDPDIIMIGEMRDGETAEIAVQSALTGHLVLSTLHTNTAASAITRLEDMGIPKYLITSSVSGIVAQRLVRRLCSYCKQPHLLSLDDIEGASLEPNFVGYQVYKASGCKHCQGTGYQGRVAIHEVLVMSDKVRSVIANGGDAREIEDAARVGGMRLLREDGVRAFLEGVTTMTEVIQVAQDRDDA